MKKTLTKALVTLAACAAMSLGMFAQTNTQTTPPPDNDAKQDMKDAGHATAEAGRKTGRAVKKGSKKAYSGTKTGTKKAYRGTKKGVHKAAQKTGEGMDKIEDKTTDRPKP